MSGVCRQWSTCTGCMHFFGERWSQHGREAVRVTLLHSFMEQMLQKSREPGVDYTTDGKFKLPHGGGCGPRVRLWI